MRIQASRVKARRRTVRLLVFLQTVLSDFPLRMQLLLSAVHADGLRRCPSSDLLIQSGWVSHHKTFRVFSRRLFLTFWQSAQPMETLRFIYIRWLASSPNSQTVAVKSVWEMRMRSPLSASAEWRVEAVLLIFSVSSLTFYTKNLSSSRQSHSQFPLVPVSRSTSCKRNSSGMQLKRSLHGSASGKKGFGEQCEMVNGDLSLPSSLPPFLSCSVTLSSLPTSPDRSAIAQLFENTANHSMAANGERMRQDLSLSCTANIHCII